MICDKEKEIRIQRTLLTCLLTYSAVQSPSWEANWFAASQEIPHISRNPKVGTHYSLETYSAEDILCLRQLVFVERSVTLSLWSEVRTRSITRRKRLKARGVSWTLATTPDFVLFIVVSTALLSAEGSLPSLRSKTNGRCGCNPYNLKTAFLKTELMKHVTWT